MSATIDLYFSFRSPYSYLAAQLAEDALADFDVDVRFRPVLPLAIREPEFFAAGNHDRVRYILADYPRRAEMLGLPVGFPNPDPIVQDMATFTISDDQPYIFRLTYLGAEAEIQGAGLAFAREVSRLIWSGTPSWDQGDHLADAAKRAGLDLSAMDAAISSGDAHKDIVEKNQEDQLAAGHRGVPLFVYNGEPFFGQDRIDSLCWRLEKDGLKR
ncbi:2-hydroxychromene-2-carboxylate isomerase [Congregibacter variabilis]|uniref:2-hydroxychromene-2-carboxylate isomerase n=1 Tax=Congregibacter variabilis TaxID=3081200 RepID=A0ABZ0I4H2_9GAMM|nr:2-hydroxychromene-2-carboxylate isomerase [Congregibacter sp. IMCC43200]